MEQSHISFEQVVSRGCGLDVHQENVVATIRGDNLQEQTRTFSTFTSSLKDLVAWLEESGITHVAMESTGVYWKPVFNILEPHFELILVNARHIKYVPGHKTDRNDSAWIAKLLLSGLLKGSFIPPQYTRELRELYRYKRKVIGQRSSEYNRLQNILETANIKLSSVVSDVFGISGWSMISAIIDGEQDPMILANLAKGRLKIKKQELICFRR
ncbi:transposase [Chitinophaga sancti]|uniref:IS110 family transposase n=1 Tax=Chitinophaga sancti TaxID=1004 RepID=UPI002A74F20B|nr:transposase [Chitinophaga sancti]WPQ60615.1 transposase [Chitinophaga sancti]